MYCSPGVKPNSHQGCFDRAALIRIIEDYNRDYPHRAIRYSKGLPTDDLWDLLRDQFAETCGNNEWCWLDQDFLKDQDDLQEYYRPPMPKTRYQWLSTDNINKALKRYEKVHKDFAYMGTVPIDFDSITEEYMKLNFCDLYNGRGMSLNDGKQLFERRQIRRFGFVFNMDPHNKKGSHWVSMFMDLSIDDPYIGYFDSYGYCPPPPQITNLMDRLKQQVSSCLGINIVKKCNTIRHQHGHTECGVYSLYFIYKCLQGESYESICENIILDDDVNLFRELFYRPTLDYQESAADRQINRELARKRANLGQDSHITPPLKNRRQRRNNHL